MTPADPTPVPRHLSEAERALWENASGPLADVAGFKSSVLRSLLTALSSEREAGERDKARLDELQRLVGMCDHVEFTDMTPNGHVVLLAAGDDFGNAVTVREALDQSIEAWKEALEIVHAHPAAPSTETPR